MVAPRVLSVVVVTVTHPPQDARIFHRELRSVLDRGHRVAYLAPFAAFATPEPDGVVAVDVPRSRGLRRLGPVWAAHRALRRFARTADVVIGHDPELLPALLWLAWRHPRLVVVWDVHEDVAAQVDEVEAIPVPLRRPLAAVIRRVEAFAERHLHLLLAEHAYQGRFRRQHPVVPNSVRVPAERPDEPVEDRVLYIGAITRPRGVEELLALAERLAPEVRLELIGNAAPELDADLRRRTAGTTVDYRGFVPNSQALSRMRGALAGLSLLHDQPNFDHSQPTKVLEYMGHGVPVITTPNTSSRALVEGHASGFVVGFGDVDAAVARVRELRADPALRERLGANGYRAAREGFDWNADGDRFVDALEAWAAAAAAPGAR